MTAENSPSKVAAADQPLNHFISAEAVVRAGSRAYAALLTTKLEPGSVWKAPTVRSELKRPRSFRIASCEAKGLSVRTPGSLRGPVTLSHHRPARRCWCPREPARLGRQVEDGELSGGLGRDAQAHPRRDEAKAAIDASGEGVGVEAGAELVDAGERHRAVGRDVLPAICKRRRDTGRPVGVAHEGAAWNRSERPGAKAVATAKLVPPPASAKPASVFGENR